MLIHENFIALSLLLVIVTIASYTDLKAHRISNRLSFGGVLSGLALYAWTFGMHGLLAGLGGAALGFGVLLPLYIMGGMAAGDVKLMAAVGAFLGPSLTLNALAFMFIAGMVMGLGVIIARRGGTAWLSRYVSSAKYLLVTGKLGYLPPEPSEAAAMRFPYALAIATGALAAVSGITLI